MSNRFKIHLSLLAILLLPNLGCFAQSGDYAPGFILEANGDSVSGFVLVKGDAFNNQTCWFKESLSSDPKSYLPKDLRSYGAHEMYFISANVESDGNTTTVFLECIIRGNVDLYKLDNRFFTRSSDQLAELKINEKRSSKDGREYAVRIDEYKSILQRAMQSCPDIHTAIKSTKLVLKELNDLFVKYHTCKGLPYKSYRSERDSRNRLVSFGFSGGMAFSKLKFKSSDSPAPFVRDTQANDLIFVPSVELQLSGLGVKNRVQITSGISLYANSYHSAEEVTSNSTRYDLTVQYWRLSLPISLKFTLSKRENGPYLLLGIGLNEMVKWEQLYTATTLSSGYVLSESSDLRNYSFYINGLAGLGKQFTLVNRVWFLNVVGDIADIIKGGSRQPAGVQSNIGMHLGLWINRN